MFDRSILGALGASAMRAPYSEDAPVSSARDIGRSVMDIYSDDIVRRARDMAVIYRFVLQRRRTCRARDILQVLIDISQDTSRSGSDGAPVKREIFITTNRYL